MDEPVVNVAIMTVDKVDFILYGDFNSSITSKTYNGKMSAECIDGNVILMNDNKESERANEIVLSPLDPKSESFLLRNVTIGLQFHWEQKQNQRFLGTLKIIAHNNKLIIINIINIEDYLVSVISSEMSPTSSLELLKSHAIISRSWLLAQINKRDVTKENKYQTEFISDDEIIRWYDREDHTLFDVCADDHCQRYQGITKTHAHNAKEAVYLTKGLVLMYNDEICDARFSKSCGGVTEVFENVWEEINHPYLQSFVDYKFDPDDYATDLSVEKNAEKWILSSPPAFCNTDDEKILDQVLNAYDRKTKDFYRWKIEYTQEELSNLINKKTNIDFGNILDIMPIKRGYSGRIIKLKIIGSKKTLVVGKELEIRKTLSESHLYSSAFVIKKENIIEGIPKRFVLIGSGWGHGVGLCQIGAAVMGEQGYKFDEILIHYFRGANIKRAYT